MAREAEANRIHTAHRDYYLWLAEQAETAWLRQEHEQWLARMRAEDGNLQAALEWSRSQPDEEEALARLAIALREYWEYTGRFSEGRRWMDEALGERDQVSTSVRANLLIAAGQFASYLGDFDQSASLLDEALALARADGDTHGEAKAISHQAYRAQTMGDIDAARALHTQGLALWQRLGDKDLIADSLDGLGFAAVLSGDIPGAIGWFEQSLALCRTGVKRYYLADSLLALGFVRFLAGEPAVAMPLLAEGLSISYALETHALTARGLEEIAFIAGMSGDVERAAHLLGAVEALRERIGVPMPPSYAHLYQQLLDILHASLGAERMDAAKAAGRLLTLKEAVTLALTPPE
jgi:non-specific serine/threonine protein kinase